MRIFIALLFPKLVKDKLYSYIESLKENYEGNFTNYDNLHLTLYYIGEINELQLKKVSNALKKINYSVFEYEIDDLSSFKNSPTQRLVHFKVKPNFNLQVLRLKVINALKLAGIEVNSTEFTPHITLGRKVKMTIEELSKIKSDVLTVKANRISIMESKRLNNELVYEEIDYHWF
ncbi:MAG: RNA 2',3'-cyclic phosphodiesterase [Candidatus Izemoplasmatales bacterium]|nr:RNA 2',3'-cyclic phosphodiesterase [Candidatus Izemoplasmatales bacterium]